MNINLPEQPVSKQNDLRDFYRLIGVSTSKPTYVPKNVYESQLIVVEGADSSLYTYDNINNVWRAATLGT